MNQTIERAVARAIMENRDNGGCIVKDWEAEERDNPHVAQALRQARAAIAAMPVQAEPVAELRAEITRLTEALRAAEEREKALREALVRKTRSTMIAELAGLPRESQYRAGIKWCGERIQDALKGPSHD